MRNLILLVLFKAHVLYINSEQQTFHSSLEMLSKLWVKLISLPHQ